MCVYVCVCMCVYVQSVRPCRCLLLRCAASLTARLVTAALRLHVAAPVIAAHGLVVVRPFRTVRVSHVFAPAPADFAYRITWIVTGLCAPPLSQLPLRGPRNLHGSGSTGQDRCVCVCVCMCVCVYMCVCVCVYVGVVSMISCGKVQRAGGAQMRALSVHP